MRTVVSVVCGLFLAAMSHGVHAANAGAADFHSVPGTESAPRAGKLFAVSNSHINKICQDHKGYMWLATDYGLARFDGSETIVFTRTPEAGSLLSNTVLCVMEDSESNLWVGSTDGIQRFDRATRTFITPRLSYPNVPDFSYVNSIIEDRKGNIWFTTSRSGVVCIRKGEDEPVCYMTTNSPICSNKTTELFEDSFGNIWIGSMDAGVSIFNSSTNSMTHLSHDPDDPSTLSGNMVFTISQTNDGRLFIGSLDGGIDSYDYRTKRVTRDVVNVEGNVYILHNSPKENAMYVGTDGNGAKRVNLTDGTVENLGIALKEFDIYKAKIHDILIDAQGNMWLVAYQKGVVMLSAEADDSVTFYSYNPFYPPLNIGTEPVLCALQSRDGALWIGTDGDGIYRAPAPGRPFGHIEGGAAGSSAILTIFQDRQGNIWAGNYLNGLSRYNSSTGSFQTVPLTNPDIPGGRVKEVNTIAEGPDGSLWIGTNGSGVCVYDPASGATRFYTHDPSHPADSQLPGNAIHDILFDGDGKVWIGTSDAGLSRLDPAKGKFKNFTAGNLRLSNNCVFSLCQDASGAVWAATRMGLNRIRDGRTQVFNERNGLLNNTVYSIVPDDDGVLWLSTGAGISSLDISTLQFSNPELPDNVLCKEFKRGSACRGSDGRIYFGGVGGIFSFRPSASHNPHQILGLAINSINVINNNKSTTTTDSGDDPAEITIPLDGRDAVRLTYDQNSFTVSFGAVEFLSPDRVVYSVMLEGHDAGWITLPPGVRTATWSSVPPGDYKLKLKASIGDFKPSQASLALSVIPPFYLTGWAKILYFLLLIGLIYFGYRMTRRHMRETELRNRQILQAQTTEQKLRFFTDISHEIRTPLTMILSPLDSLREKTRDKQSLHTLDVMSHNGRRILRLIDQIMDLQRIDNHRMSLSVSQVALRPFIEDLAGAFEEVASRKNISFDVEIDSDLPEEIPMDADKMDKVVFNLLSNAFKFTPAGGNITLKVGRKGENLAIRVSDTGPGIPPESRDRVFNRFYRVADAASASAPGTGIGLHLARELSDLHHGSISIESSSSAGTTFLVLIPLDPEAYEASERMDSSESSDGETTAGNIPVLPAHHVDLPPEKIVVHSDDERALRHATILIVEDEAAILEYLTRELSDHFNVLTASNGTEGLEIALTRHPDLIITDVMMDGLDGLELCRKVRANQSTCEIPVVMLTAKVTQAQHNEGILAGADAYITKPFNISFLHNRVNMLIHQRRMMKEKYSGSTPVNTEVTAIKSNDERLIERVRKVVLKELANPNLSVELIAREIGVSRSHLQRRLKVAANINPSEYIRGERMRHAAMLLTTKDVAVSEVAYATGFSTLSHFSTCFREHFGMSPTRYAALHGKGPAGARYLDSDSDDELHK